VREEDRGMKMAPSAADKEPTSPLEGGLEGPWEEPHNRTFSPNFRHMGAIGGAEGHIGACMTPQLNPFGRRSTRWQR